MAYLTLEELERLARKKTLTTNDQLRANYKLARRLGFTSTEARILSFRGRETILRLATQRKEQHEASRAPHLD